MKYEMRKGSGFMGYRAKPSHLLPFMIIYIEETQDTPGDQMVGARQPIMLTGWSIVPCGTGM